jgi:hypothetical protein
MDRLNITDIKRNFTKLEEELYSFVSDKVIKLHDVLVYVSIKTQVEGRYDTSNGSISRIFKLRKSTITDSVSRLVDAKLVEIEYNNGKSICRIKKLEDEEFDKIPKTLLMSSLLDVKQKTFLLAAWAYIKDNSLMYTRRDLHKLAFQPLNVGLRWVNSRVDELVDLGVLDKGVKELKIDFSKIVEMSDLVIEEVLEDSAQLEETVVEYETKTGVDRDKIFDWEPTEGTIKKEFNSPKWLEPITKAILDGCVALGKKPFSFNSGEFKAIGDHVKEIIEKRDGDSEERCITKIIESIQWKIDKAVRNPDEKKYYTSGYFVRKKKNNIASTLYHYEMDRKNNPYANKPSAPAKAAKRVIKKKATKSNDINVDWDANDNMYGI